MQSDVFMERAQSISVGSLSPTINWKTLASEEFALPPLTEQQRLLQLIQSATQTIYELYNLNQVLKVLRGSLRVEYFEDKARHIRLIRDCVVNNGVQIGPFGAQLHQSDYSEEGVPVIMPQNMIDDKVLVDGIARVPLEIARRLSVHQVQVGDILLPRRGELDRRALITSENDGWLCGTGSVRIRLDPSIPSDLAVESLASRKSMMWLNANAVGTTMQNINTSIVESIPLSLPSSEAWAYASQLFGFVRSALSAVEVRREMAIKQIHKAVNGENSDAL
jgi:type I restriction enzyme S subunit